ncbi:S9 family peptidase [Kitasatospora sp. NPDC059577]|uniref:S9 family peptidase n=1 Tax=Kitasatospora sp. NPDC059577 TaxID=3346873 RepID=UPI0036899C53
MSEEKSAVPAWEQRFRAARVSLPDWAEDAPDRALYVSNATGTYEVYAWDRATGDHRRVTDRPNGTTDAELSPDGAWVWWFDDHDGDEFGVWRRQPFAGGPDEEAVPGLAPSYSAGLALGRDGTVVVGRSTDEDGTTLHLRRPGDAEPVEIYRHAEYGGIGDLSHDGTLLAIDHTEHGDAMHSAIRVVRLTGTATETATTGTATGTGTAGTAATPETVAELDEVTGRDEPRGVACLGFAPVEGDTRLLVAHQRTGRWEPMIWDVATGVETALPLRDEQGRELPGDVSAQWRPGAGELLVEHEYEARSELFSYALADGRLTRLDTPRGTVGGATGRPDGTVEYLWSSAAEPSAVRSTAGTVVLRAPGAVPPASVPVEDVWVDGPGGRVHALVQRPAGTTPGDGPLPTVFEIHGGPTHHDSDSFAAGPAAWLDHGFAVVRVNYRGSTGYGQAWTDALHERVGLIELEDIAAVRAWAVDSGLADPRRLVLTGGSWGGYLTLLGLGVQPDAWAVGVAAVPVADYHTAYADEMEALKSLDRTLFGGTPEEVPDRFTASSPLTYVDRVRVPVYISAGVNDPRCPIRQIENYVERLEQLGKPHEVYRYDAGHGSLVVEERIKQLRLEIDFVRRYLDVAAGDADGESA